MSLSRVRRCVTPLPAEVKAFSAGALIGTAGTCVQGSQPRRDIEGLDKPIGEDDLSLGDVLPGEGGDPLDELELSLQRDALRRAIAELPDTERELITMR